MSLENSGNAVENAGVVEAADPSPPTPLPEGARGAGAPRWQELSGLTAEGEALLSEDERRKGLRRAKRSRVPLRTSAWLISRVVPTAPYHRVPLESVSIFSVPARLPRRLICGLSRTVPLYS